MNQEAFYLWIHDIVTWASIGMFVGLIALVAGVWWSTKNQP